MSVGVLLQVSCFHSMLISTLTFIRWPVIIALIFGGIIVLSVCTCLARCLCFGYSCCCTFFTFLDCCNCCRSCCYGRKNRRVKDTEQNPPISNGQGYITPAPMMTGGRKPPSYARLSSGNSNSKQFNDDALPAMPSWDSAKKVYVLDEELDKDKDTEAKPKAPSSEPKSPTIPALAPMSNTSSLIQNRLDQSTIPNRWTSNVENGSHRANSPYQDVYYGSKANSYSQYSNPGNGYEQTSVDYRGPSAPLGIDRNYNHPVQMSYQQYGHFLPQNPVNKYGPPGPAINSQPREYDQPQDSRLTSHPDFRA